MVAALARIGRIERVTLAERVYAELCNLLMAGELARGQKLSLRSIAETLGVSMMPVREAVTRLAADDALEVLPNRAVSVPLITRARFQDLITVRSAIYFAIYHATGLPPLVSIIEGLWLKIGPALNLDLKTFRESTARWQVATDVLSRRLHAARQALVDDITGAAPLIQSTGGLPS